MEPTDSLSLKSQLSIIKFEGNLRSGATCFPDSAMLPDWMRGGLKFALRATKKLGWGGLGDRSEWTTYKGWDGEGPVEYGVSLAGLSLDAASAWIQESPVSVPVDITQESLLSGELAVRIGDFIDKTLWTLCMESFTVPAYLGEWMLVPVWFLSVHSRGRMLSDRGRRTSFGATRWWSQGLGPMPNRRCSVGCAPGAAQTALKIGLMALPRGSSELTRSRMRATRGGCVFSAQYEVTHG